MKDPGHSAKSAGGRLQLNKHTPYVCGFAWSDMVHGCIVYTERAEMAAVSCGTSHSSAVVRHFGGYSKTRYKKLFTHVESDANAVSLLNSGEQCYIKAISNSNLHAVNFIPCMLWALFSHAVSLIFSCSEPYFPRSMSVILSSHSLNLIKTLIEPYPLHA